MASLISASTARRISELLAKADTPASSAPYMRPPAESGPSILPFDLFWCRSSGKFRVYLPAGCYVVDGVALTVDTSAMTAVTGWTDWYEFDAPAADGVLCAVGNGTTFRVAPYEADSASLRLLAGITQKAVGLTTVWMVKQHWRGAIRDGATSEPWGILIAGGAVTLRNGCFKRGPVFKWLGDMPSHTITPGATETWISAKIDTDAGTAQIISGEKEAVTNDAIPVDPQFFKLPLYKLRHIVSGGVTSYAVELAIRSIEVATHV